MNHYELAAFLTFVTSALLVLFVLVKDRRKQLNRTFIQMSCILALYGYAFFNTCSSTDAAQSLLWGKLTMFLSVAFAVTYLHLSLIVVAEKISKYTLLLIYGIVIAYGFVDFPTALILTTPRPAHGLPLMNSAGVLYLPSVMLFLGLVTFTIFKILKGMKGASPAKVNQLKYFILAPIVAVVGGASNFIVAYDVTLYPINPFVGYIAPFFNIIIAYAIIKHHLMDINVAITKATIFIVTYLFVLVLPFWFGYGTGLWSIAVLLMGILATIGPLLYRFLQDKAENILLSEQRRYQKILLQTANGMARQHDLAKLIRLMVYVVQKTVRNRFSAIYLNDPVKNEFRLKAVRNRVDVGDAAMLRHDSPSAAFFLALDKPVYFDEMPEQVRASFTFPLPVNLVVPIVYGKNMLALMILGDKLNGKPYTSDDLNIFRILSSQAALAIENCLFIEEFKVAQEKIFVAEKLASIGGLAEGVAHQVNNRLNHFSMISGELKYEIDSFRQSHPGFASNPADIEHLLQYFEKITGSLLDNVKRTDGIVKGILNYARVESKETLFSSFFLQEIIDLSLDLLKVKHGVSAFPLVFDRSTSDVVYGIKSQLMESVYNILDNCYEATLERAMKLSDEEMPRYNPRIDVSIQQRPSSVLIRFSDNGIGIKAENVPKVFAPFFTTKASSKSGTGIGMYVVRRMIEENHRGKIWFKTVYGEGTDIYVEIPNAKAAGEMVADIAQ